MIFAGSNRAQDLLISDLPTLDGLPVPHIRKFYKNTTLNKNQKNIDMKSCSLNLSQTFIIFFRSLMLKMTNIKHKYTHFTIYKTDKA